MDPSVLYSLIQSISRGDTDLAESQIENHRQSNVDSLISAIISVISQHSNDVPVVQTALFVLKKIVPKSWSIGFEEYEGPAISPDLKTETKSMLVDHLIGHPTNKVRSVAALLAATIASVEYPDEWPDLIESVCSPILHGDKHKVYGALLTLKELVGETITDEFRQVGKLILQTIYTVASSPSDTSNNDPISGGPKLYSPFASAMAIQIFGLCTDLFVLPGEEDLDSDTAEIVSQWGPLLVEYLGKPTNPEDKGWTYIKMESAKSFTSLLAVLVKPTSKFGPQAFESIIQNLLFLLPSYAQHHINNIGGESDGLDNDDSTFFSDEISLKALIYEEYELLIDLISHKSIAKKLINNVAGFFDLLVKYAQITLADEELWSADMNEFVKEEGELSFGKDVRSQILGVVSAAYRTRQINIVKGMVEKALEILDSSESTWKLRESALYILALAVAEDHENQQTIPPAAVNYILKYISEYHTDSHILLRARSFITGATVCKNFSQVLDEKEVRIPFFERTVDAAVSDQEETVKAACILSFSKYCSIIQRDYITTKLETIYQIISAITPITEEDTPSIFAEVLMTVIQANVYFSAQYPKMVEIIYNLLSKDVSNIMLSNEIEDIMAELAETATEDDVYPQFIQHALPPLLQSILSIKDWDYTPELVLSLNLLAIIIDKGPVPVPEDVLNIFFEPLYKIVSNSTDAQVLQSATEVLSFLCDHASEQIKQWHDSDGKSGIELLIMIVARLLDPTWEDDACISSGLLIVSIVDKFGQVIGQYLPEILEATAKRLATAKQPILIENFIKVFSELIIKNTNEALDFLSSQQIEIDAPVTQPNGTINVAPGAPTERKVVSGLHVVISKWIANFDILRGYDEIRTNILALGRLFELHDSRINSIVVEGDLLPVPADVIMTRSKARAHGTIYTQVTANVKIIKLFLRELIIGKFMEERDTQSAIKETSLGARQADNDGDDDWEDEDEFALEGGFSFKDAVKYVDIEDIDPIDGEDYGENSRRALWGGTDRSTQVIIAEWLKHVTTQYADSFKENIYPQLSPEEQAYLQKLA